MSPLPAKSQTNSPASSVAAARRKWLVCLALALAIAATYSGVIHLGFVDFDDDDYILNNPAIQHGLNGAAISWAFTTAWAANWHPLTWMVLTVDYSLFGAHPLGYHVANAVWHLLNSVVLFLWLEYATGALWRSAAVAAFFALHPFHVESVAWASERKDVLSTFFWIISVWLYCAYASPRDSADPRRTGFFYAASLAVFALGLMSKPMLVTLPCVLLLLDYWPLRRPISIQRKFVEKVPFFALSAVVSVVTILAQKDGGALKSFQTHSLESRLENMPVAYARYLIKTAWPSSFSFFYPYIDHWPALVVGASALLVLVITAIAITRWRRQPYLLVGWLWFLGMIFPTIGLVQVGEQGMADRYTYLAMVGLLIMVAWTLGDLAIKRSWMAPLSGALAGGALLFCSARTVTQTAYWRDTITLFGHAADLSRDNYLAYYNLGCFLAKKGDRANAIAYFERSIEGNARNARAYNNLAFLQIDQGQFDQAISNLLQAVELRPDYPEAWLNLGRAYDARGDAANARRAFETSLAREPDLPEAHYRLGDLLLRQGALSAGVSNLQSAADLQPRAAKYRLKLANAWVASHQLSKAVNEYEVALKLDPDLAEACNNLAWIMATSPDASLRDGALAVEVARHAVQLTSAKNPLLLGTFAAALAENGAFDQAADAAAQAHQLAASQTNNALAAALAAQVELYRAHQPFRDATVK